MRVSREELARRWEQTFGQRPFAEPDPPEAFRWTWEIETGVYHLPAPQADGDDGGDDYAVERAGA